MITKNDNKITISNSLISREFLTHGKKLNVGKIENLISKKVLTPTSKSKAFELVFSGFPKKKFGSGNMTLSRTVTEEGTNSDRVDFVFEDISVSGAKLTVTLTVTLGNNDRYVRQQLSIAGADKCTAKLETISIDLFGYGSTLKTWQIPKQKSCASTSNEELMYGQPVYVDSMFFGCEFPAARNSLRKNVVSLQYANGRPLCDICTNGVFTSWPCIAGCASSDNTEVITADFFEYIRTIAVPSPFRRQYNSWYDYMYDIDDASLEKSFLQIDKGCARFGVRPLDAFVADDGWNDYDGNFWGFNKKFPDELFPSMKLAHSLGSTFGLWLGPRGGYNNQVYSFAQNIEKAGMGHANKKMRDICAADHTYQKHLGQLLVNFTNSFDLSYWKLDGFCLSTCEHKNHGHMTGGKNHAFFYTDLWENWIKIFTALREARQDIWLNTTCYVNPSPWFLQWVNSVWIQNSNDVGFCDKSSFGQNLGGNDKDRMLTYRDDRYYDFYNVRQLRFPQSNLYNHDPIYATTAKVSMSGKDFLEFLLFNACRGTAFWELYYSPTMMDDEKWAYNAAVLEWAEKYSHVLSTSRFIGNSPKSGDIYGYSCWKNNCGIVALRNPSAKTKAFTFTLNERNGVTSSAHNLLCTDVLNGSEIGAYSYNESVKVTLEAHQSIFMSFGENKLLCIPDAPPETVLVTGNLLNTEHGFAVKADVPQGTSGTLFAQGEDVVLKKEVDGTVVFSFCSLQVQVRLQPNTAAVITAVRERNGALKLYVNGKLENCAYTQENAALKIDKQAFVIGTDAQISVYEGALYYDEV